MKKLDDMQSEKVSGGKIKVVDNSSNLPIDLIYVCDECGKQYKALGLSWHELPSTPVEIEYQFDY